MSYSSCDGEAEARRFAVVVGVCVGQNGEPSLPKSKERRLGVIGVTMNSVLLLEILCNDHQAFASSRVFGVSRTAAREDLR